MARIMVFKIWPSQEILKIRDGTPLEAEGILTYIKSPRNRSVWHFPSKLDAPSNILQKKRVARIMVFKIWPSQEILKIHDGTPLEAEGILTYIKKTLEMDRFGTFLVKILKIHDGAPLEAEGILTYIKKPSKQTEILKIRDGTPLENKRVARILVFKIWPSQEILKIRDGTPLEAEGILKRMARILVFKIWPSQEILKIRDGTPLEAEGILTYIKSPRNRSVWHFSIKLDVPSNVVHKKRMTRIIFLKIWPSQEILKIRDEILKIRDGTPLEAEGILTYIKSPRNRSVWHFPSKLDVPSNILQKKRVARIMVFKIWPSQEILKILDGTPLEKKRVARIMVFKIWPSQEILKIHDGAPLEAEGILTYIKKPSKQIEIFKIGDGTPLEAEGILTYIKSPRNRSVWHFSRNLDVPSNVVHKKRMARIIFLKIWPSQEILKIRDVARIMVFKIWPSQETLKIHDGTPLEAEGILTYIKKTLEMDRVARIMVFKIWPSQEILKIHDGAPLEAEGILTYIKKPSKQIGLNKRVARILVFKIWPSQEILKIRDGTPLEYVRCP
ncbi:hypothetical protein OROMI_004641 [Orobanche minor]